MPAPSKVELLPPGIRAELDKRLIESGFSSYQGLSDWLLEQGIEIGKSALGSYGKKLQDQLAELKLSHTFALAYQVSMPDETGATTQMLGGMAQDILYRVMLKLHYKSRQLDDDSDLWGILRQLETATKALANVGRVDIAVSKYAGEERARQERKLSEIKSEGVKRGIDSDFLATMDKYLGLEPIGADEN